MVPPRAMMKDETRTASTATERRAIETIHAIYWTFLRDLFKTASALNRPQGCRLRDMQRCMGAIAPTRSGKKTDLKRNLHEQTRFHLSRSRYRHVVGDPDFLSFSCRADEVQGRHQRFAGGAAQ